MSLFDLFRRRVVIGPAEFATPAGWKEVRRQANEYVILRSKDGRQQVTVSVAFFSQGSSFDDFRKLCDLRIEAEGKELGKDFIKPSEPFQNNASSGMFFYGAQDTGRGFSGYLSLVSGNLITIYLEGTGVAVKRHTGAWSILAGSLRRV